MFSEAPQSTMSETNILTESQDKGGNAAEQDFQDVLKAEFNKLHIEYRNLENKRHGIAHRDGYIHKRTEKIMPMLEQDHSELQHEMHNATCKAHQRKADDIAKSMKEALKTYDLYQHEIAKKIKQVLEIEKHVDRITEKVIKQRFKMLALHGMSKTLAQRERELAKEEDKLYHCTCACNLQANENKKLRDEIMDFLTERKRFFEMHNNIKRQIARAKKKMLSIVQQAIATYDSRDEAMSKVKALREREAKEVKQHGLELQEFERTLHHDKSILDFIKTKLRPRPAFENAKDKRIRVGSAKEKELDEILKKYRKSFKRILSYSRTHSILDLVDKYNNMDFENFENFLYVTDLNNECEVLRLEIESLKSQIEDVHTLVEKKEREQRQAQQRLQMAIIHGHDHMAEMEKQLEENRQKESDIFATLAAALVLTNCDTSPIMRLLGNMDGINEHNIRLCLTQLDIKVTKMKIDRDRYRELTSSSTNVNVLKSVLGKSKQLPSQGGPFLPKVLMFHGESVDEDDTRIFEQEPYYYEEMKQYVFEKMIEDRLVDAVQRSLSISTHKIKSEQALPTGTASRKTLSQKVHASRMEVGRRRKKRNPLEHDVEETKVIEQQQQEVARRKTEVIVRMGHEAEAVLLHKDHSHHHEHHDRDHHRKEHFQLHFAHPDVQPHQELELETPPQPDVPLDSPVNDSSSPYGEEGESPPTPVNYDYYPTEE